MSTGGFFSEASLLVDGEPIETPQLIDRLFAVIDTSVKTGSKQDGIGAVYFGLVPSDPSLYRLAVLDWDIKQVDVATTTDWLRAVFGRLEALAREWRVLRGIGGAWIERDKAAGEVLLQQGRNQELEVHAIPDSFTSLGGQSERALRINARVSGGDVKLARLAYERTVEFKGVIQNHLMAQILGFRLDVKQAQRAELLMAFCAGVYLALNEGG